MQIKNTSLYFEKGDIRNFSGDAIILPTPKNAKSRDVYLANPTKENPFAKRKVLSENIGPGQAYFEVKDGGQQKYEIFTVVNGRSPEKTQANLRLAFARALMIVHQLNLYSVAIAPLIRERKLFPSAGEAKILIQEILKYLKTQKSTLKNILLCVSDPEDYEVFYQTIQGYVTHLQDTLGDGPYVTVDAIIEMDDGIILIERSNPPYGWALPGGFVDYGESLEAAVLREVKEETNMEMEGLCQFHVYSDPKRDPRFHTVSTAFIGQGKGKPAFGDDAKGLQIVKYEDLLGRQYAFDHNRIIEDYLNQKKRRGYNAS